MQGGRVLAERDDVLVGRLRVVLPGGSEEGEVQLQLAPIGALEQPPQLLVAGRGAAVGLGEAGYLVWRLGHPQRVQRPR